MTTELENAAARQDAESYYTLEFTAELTGISTQTILHYREEGLVPCGQAAAEQTRFDDESLRALRRIEHVRSECEMNLSGLKMMMGLLQEIDRLRDELRSRGGR